MRPKVVKPYHMKVVFVKIVYNCFQRQLTVGLNFTPVGSRVEQKNALCFLGLTQECSLNQPSQDSTRIMQMVEKAKNGLAVVCGPLAPKHHALKHDIILSFL